MQQMTINDVSDKTLKPLIPTLYHYTLKNKLLRIAKDGFIKMSPHDLSSLFPGESPFVWLSSNDEWEETVFMNNSYEQLDAVGRVRLTIDINKPILVLKAEDMKYKIPHWDGLKASGEIRGALADEWYVVPSNIPVEFISLVEEYEPETKQWLPSKQ